jgi:hypothetical protein
MYKTTWKQFTLIICVVWLLGMIVAYGLQTFNVIDGVIKIKDGVTLCLLTLLFYYLYSVVIQTVAYKNFISDGALLIDKLLGDAE